MHVFTHTHQRQYKHICTRIHTREEIFLLRFLEDNKIKKKKERRETERNGEKRNNKFL